ncbi:hypothetical protein AAL_05389 [Moelleriella libera RCEF 2490]|uniref:Uncharacterized protein n=1 Tax=Moelleriella libera RCEF 2490 TaxID=1081109 RepID=A0A162IHV2_9HYPO|nr:hypothetical protein AAL_05389 [Moelleriella libera RCEF 2490]
MKYTILIAIAAAAAATPAPPSESAAKKLPWLEGSKVDCGIIVNAVKESCIGTGSWCNSEWAHQAGYVTPKDCFAARETAPKPEPEPKGLTDTAKATRAKD